MFLLYTSTSGFKWIRIILPHHLPLRRASNSPSHLLPLLGKIPSQQGIFPKEATTVLVLHSFPAVFVNSIGLDFLSFTQFLLLTLSVVPGFFSSCFFIFTHFLLYKRIWTFVGQIMLTRSNGSWAQFALICRSHSAKKLYSAADLYSAIDLHSATDLHSAAYHFPLHFFLWTFLALRSSWWVFGLCFSLGFPSYGLLSLASYWAFFLMGFWIRICKKGHQQVLNLDLKYDTRYSQNFSCFWVCV